MAAAIAHLLNQLKDPMKEMALVRSGLKTQQVELFLTHEKLPVKEVLKKLNIPASTYFAKKKSRQSLDAYTTEKFIRLMTVIKTASALLGKSEAKSWLDRKIPSLGNETPLNLLDTETGHRLVEQTLSQIKYGIYG